MLPEDVCMHRKSRRVEPGSLSFTFGVWCIASPVNSDPLQAFIPMGLLLCLGFHIELPYSSQLITSNSYWCFRINSYLTYLVVYLILLVLDWCPVLRGFWRIIVIVFICARKVLGTMQYTSLLTFYELSTTRRKVYKL